jgi:hypothetical protein
MDPSSSGPRVRSRSSPGTAGHSRGMNYTQTGRRTRLFA